MHLIKNTDALSSKLVILPQNSPRSTASYDPTTVSLEATTARSETIKLIGTDSTTIFPFHIRFEDINSPFSIHSPKFKTAPHGYLFILRVCSTIDSTNEYLSIYITLLCGDYDPILFYPFPYNIILSLYDQSGEGKHITTIIKADENRSYFARPTGENNNEVGIMKFCPLSYLTDDKSVYLKDGVFFYSNLYRFYEYWLKFWLISI